MPVLSTRIVLDCFYLLIFYSEKFSTDVFRLPYAVNVNLNLSNDILAAATIILHLNLYFRSSYHLHSMFSLNKLACSQFMRPYSSIGTLRSNEADGDENVKKTKGLISKTDNNFARASRFFVHFSPVFARLRRESA